MKKETLLTIAVLILIVLNVALLVVFNVNQGRPPFAPPLPMRNFPPENTPRPGKVIATNRLGQDEEAFEQNIRIPETKTTAPGKSSSNPGRITQAA